MSDPLRLLAAERKLAGVGIRNAKALRAALEEAAASSNTSCVLGQLTRVPRAGIQIYIHVSTCMYVCMYV